MHAETPHYKRGVARLEAYVEELRAATQQDFFGNGFDSDDEEDPAVGRVAAPAPQGRITCAPGALSPGACSFGHGSDDRMRA